MKTIMGLEADDCRWPLGRNEDGDQLFCCRAAGEGLSYCPPHGRMSTADGSDPRARAPQSEPRFPRAHRAYLDVSTLWTRRRRDPEHEPDLVEIFGAGK